MSLRSSLMMSLLAGLMLAGAIATPWTARSQENPAKAGQAQGGRTAPPAAAGKPAPVGAIWVSTEGSFYRDTPRIDRFIEDLRAKPFGEAVIQVVDGQKAFYNSGLLPKATGVPEQFDPLAVLLKGLQAQPKGVRLIAWVSPFRAGNINQTEPGASRHVLSAHPEWLSPRADGSKSDADGNLYLEPGLAEVRQHVETVVQELLRNYPVDGIYFDLVGDPGADWGYHPAVIEAWRQKTGSAGNPEPGDETWIAFRAELLTQALEGMTRAAHAARPGVIVGVGAGAEGNAPAGLDGFRQTPAYREQHQDWPAWLLSKQPVSRIYLKNFKAESANQGAFDAWMEFALLAARPTRVQVMVGVDGSLNEAVLAMTQLRKAIQSGAGGVALRDYAKPVRDQDAQEPFMTAIRNTVLSAEYMRTMARIPRVADFTPEPPPAEGTAATPSATAAVDLAQSTRTVSATTASLEAPLALPAGSTRAAGAPTTTSDEMVLPLPPPPSAAAATTARRTAALDAGTTASQGDDSVVTVRRARVVPNAEGTATSATASNVTTSSATMRAMPGLTVDPATRRQMLEEMLNDQAYRAEGERLIQPDEKYRSYLKQRFGNIFD